MSGLSGLNKSAHGVGVGLMQLQLPVVDTPAQLAAQTQRIVEMVGKARRNQAGMDIVVFPEYALHGLSMNTDPALMCSLDGPEVIRRLDFTQQPRIDATYEEHAKILKAIRSHRGDQAAMLLRAHIETSQAEVRKITPHQVHMARHAGRVAAGRG